MKPSVGRIVIYRPGPMDTFFNNGTGHAPAVITRVFNDTCVNLRVLGDGATCPAWKQSVVQGDGEYQWQWPERV